ncbi:PiggyBac transposable element-derived protein 4 [Dictyocoela muelleri]|nr:PiggyBac transposable element-derived protein 4 [Dictyocoela muelleri]
MKKEGFLENSLSEILFTDEIVDYENNIAITDKKRAFSTCDAEWSQILSTPNIYNFTGNPGMLVSVNNSIESFFDLFFKETLLNYILTLTKKKISKKNRINNDGRKTNKPNYEIYIQDIYAYVSILLIFGIKNPVNVQHCWNKTKKYSYNKNVCELMKFPKFQFINRHITCISDKDIKGLKLKKCPKIVEALESLFSNTYMPGEFLALDEGMMAYKGKIKNRVYSPYKPDKWGMKFYILAESNTGFICNLRVVGEKTSLEETVVSLCKKISGEYRRLFMDNFYNSFKLTKILHSNKIYTTGTLRNRRGGPNDLLKLKTQVSAEKSVVLGKDDVQVLIWYDKKPVVMLTNCYDSHEYIHIKNKRIPKVVNEYNKHMGGVDKFDQMIKYYPLKRKSNRWTQKFTCHVFEIIFHNSYVLYKQFNNEKKN